MLSVILPACNEEEMLPLVHGALSEVLRDIPHELVFVDDGSGDGTWKAIQAAAAEDGTVRGLHFSRNFGKEAALLAGLAAAKGDCCLTMDCDLQHPPEKIPEMYALWQQGYEVVEGVKEDRGEESGMHRAAAGTFYGLISRAAKLDLRDASDFKLLDRKVVDALNAMPERNVFYRALSYWVGFRRTTVTYSVAPRPAGKSKWSTLRLTGYALRNITSFTAAPMQLVTWTGAVFFVLAVILSIQTLWRKFTGQALDGFTTAILVEALSGGIIMLSLGVIGYYIARIYEELKGRPRYIVSETCGKTEKKTGNR